MSDLGCDCRAFHVRVRLGELEQADVHLEIDDLGIRRRIGGECSRGATEEDGLCDECRRIGRHRIAPIERRQDAEAMEG